MLFALMAFTGGDHIARLIDMNGHVVRQWRDAGYHSTLLDPAVNGGKPGQVLVTLKTVAGEGTELLPGLASRRVAKTVGELDWDGNVVWRFGDQAPGGAALQHHDWARLGNGNTFIDEGQHGRLFQVTPSGDIVWEYVNPYPRIDQDSGSGRAIVNRQLYRAQPVPYGWVPSGVEHTEQAVAPPAIDDFRMAPTAAVDQAS
ncbi:MAG: hypothetical protein RQ715_02430 [Methylococcales bacterium]|nr:hypothetical protein [Methylococcales bacterium]